MKTRNEELRYMFRQPLLCLACAAPTTRIAPLDAFEPCRGCGCTCLAAKFLAHLAPRTPDLLHLISLLPLFYSLFVFMHLTQSNPTLTCH